MLCINVSKQKPDGKLSNYFPPKFYQIQTLKDDLFPCSLSPSPSLATSLISPVASTEFF